MAAFAGLALSVGLCGAAAAAVADDPTGNGPYTAKSGDYKLPAGFDQLVTKQVAAKTELWARVWYPTKGPDLKDAPIVVFLHGEHGTCGKVDPTGKWRLDGSKEYSSSGTCTGEYPIVTPNHWGYDYIAERLATQGYVTISINTNLGINQTGYHPIDPDPFLIIRRGRMILRHLMQFGRWNSGLDTSNRPSFFSNFQGKLDFSKISLVGHSRGGDAIVNAYFQLVGNTDGWQSRLPGNAKIVALAAMAPTDFAAQRNVASQIPMDGAAYGVLLPMCDGDVSRLSGMRFYDRAVGYFPDDGGNYRAAFAVEGADHNGFNTEWHTQDNYSLGGDNQPTLHKCLGQKKLFKEIGTVADQQEIGRYFVMSIIRSKTKDGSWAELLNPAYDLPKPLAEITKYDRSYFPATDIGANKLLSRFAAYPQGACANKVFGYMGVTTQCTNNPEHFFNYQNYGDAYNAWAARIRWGAPANKKKPEDGYYWAFFTMYEGTKPVNISKMKSIEMRIGPDCTLFSGTDIPGDNDDDPELACSDLSKQAMDEAGSQNVAVQFVDDKRKYSNRHMISLKELTRERQAIGIEENEPSNPVKPLYHALMSTVRIPMSEFLRDADKGFNPAKITGMFVLLSPKGAKKDNGSGGLIIGDIWATQNTPFSMNFDAPADLPAVVAVADRPHGSTPRPPSLEGFTPGTERLPSRSAASGVRTASADGAAGPADVGARIVDVARASNPGLSGAFAGAGGPDVAEITVSTLSTMIESSSGFSVTIGGKAAQGVRVERASANPRETTIAVPAALVDGAADGAPVAVSSGGSVWRFGSLSKTSVR